MINILRTSQVRAAQKGVPTGLVYKQNEERLNEVGTSILENMLYTRDWEGLPVHTQRDKAAANARALMRKVEQERSGDSGHVDLDLEFKILNNLKI